MTLGLIILTYLVGFVLCSLIMVWWEVKVKESYRADYHDVFFSSLFWFTFLPLSIFLILARKLLSKWEDYLRRRDD